MALSAQAAASSSLDPQQAEDHELDWCAVRLAPGERLDQPVGSVGVPGTVQAAGEQAGESDANL